MKKIEEYNHKYVANELTEMILKNILNGIEEIIRARCKLVIEHALNVIEKEYLK